MIITPEMRDLARHLLACEANAAADSKVAESATLRVYEKLRENLCVLVGVAGFQALAFRALTLTRSEVPGLGAVQVAADGNLQGMSEIESRMKGEKDGDFAAGVILISHLFQLLLMFLGEVLTMNLVQNVWPDAALNNGNPRDGRKA